MKNKRRTIQRENPWQQLLSAVDKCIVIGKYVQTVTFLKT